MKKFENPMLSIVMFDAAVATGDSSRMKVDSALQGKGVSASNIDKVEWNSDDWFTL